MKSVNKFLSLLMIVMISVSFAAAEPVQIDLNGGISVRLHEEWDTVETYDNMKETGCFSMVVSRDGESLYSLFYTDETFSEPKYETEVVHWFKDDVSGIIPRDARFSIKDINTGRIFEAVRYDGRNHMDAEPFSKKDADIIREIYGGKYGWDFRPVLVQYEGHVYAASMNGMPHGKGIVPENDFDGHFCIHFKGSMQHGEWVVNDYHQLLIDKAAEASW